MIGRSGSIYTPQGLNISFDSDRVMLSGVVRSLFQALLPVAFPPPPIQPQSAYELYFLCGGVHQIN